MKRSREEIERREALAAKPLMELTMLRDELIRRRELLGQEVGRGELLAALARRRVLRMSGDAVLGARLDRRIERLFEAVRRGEQPWPMDEVVRVIDGLVGRLVSRRILLSLVGLLTVIPAIGSLALLAKQNAEMIEKNRVEEWADFREDRTNLTDVIFARAPQVVVGENGESVVEDWPAFHPRLRGEAFGTLIALEKQRWTPEEREAVPPTRYLDFRGSDLGYLPLGAYLGVETGTPKTDFSRLWLKDCDLRHTQFTTTRLDYTVFRGANAEGILIQGPSMDHVDFREVEAPGAQFHHNGKTGDFLSMVETKFDRSRLRGAVFNLVYAERASFEETDLSGVVFQESNFLDCDFTTASLGEEADWSQSAFHRCLVTEEQAEVIRLPEFCFLESGGEPNIRRIMTDPEKYEAWFASYRAELEARSRAELEALGLSPEGVADQVETGKP